MTIFEFLQRPKVSSNITVSNTIWKTTFLMPGATDIHSRRMTRRLKKSVELPLMIVAAHKRSLAILLKNFNYHLCRNKRFGRSSFRSEKHFKPSKPIGYVYSPLWKITHPKPIGFVYSPLWKVTHQNSSVLCTPPFEKSLFLMGAYLGVGVYFSEYGVVTFNSQV